MNQKFDIVCIGLPRWEGDYAKSTVMLLSLMAAKHRVLYVDYAHTIKDAAASLAGGNEVPVDRMFGFHNRLREVKTGAGTSVHLLTLPPILPINWMPQGFLYNLALRINGMLVRPFILGAMKRLGISRPVVINAFNPFLGLPLAGKLNERVLLYYCYDDIGSARWLKKHGERVEKAFAAKADAIVTSSDALRDQKSSYGCPTYVVKNGVDADLFARGDGSSEHPLNSKTIVGYIGSIDDRLDYGLLEGIIPRLPEYQFQFIGRVTHDEFAQRLRSFSNVEMVDPQPMSALPGFVHRMSLGIIPFVKNEFTRNIYPLKINEYLAAGIPVVMTDFASLPEFAELVSVASAAGEFASMVKGGIENDRESERPVRVAFARNNSWMSRAESFNDVIASLASAGKAEE